MQAIVVVDQSSVEFQGTQDALPEIHGIDPKADCPDAALALQFANSGVAFFQRPLGMGPALVLDVVDVNYVEVLRSEPGAAFLDRAADPFARVIQSIVTIAVGVRVFADLSGKEITVARHPF